MTCSAHTVVWGMMAWGREKGVTHVPGVERGKGVTHVLSTMGGQ